MKLRIDNMSCSGCARGVTATIQAIDPNAKVDVDLTTKLVTVETTASVEQISTALAEDDFPAQLQ